MSKGLTSKPTRTAASPPTPARATAIEHAARVASSGGQGHAPGIHFEFTRIPLWPPVAPVAATTREPRLLQRKVDGTLARRPGPPSGTADDPERAVERAGGDAGHDLDAGLRERIERATGRDLGGMRVHLGDASQEATGAVAARAYTVGHDIHFAAGQYRPGSRDGDHLIAHEVAHALQAPPAPPHGRMLAVSQPGDAAEIEADRFADSILDGKYAAAATTSGAALHRTPAPPTYQGATAVVDPAKVALAPIADFPSGSGPRSISPNVQDSSINKISWELYDAADKFMPGGNSTVSGVPDATTRPFNLRSEILPAQGQYLLRLIGRGKNGEPIAYADQYFNVVAAAPQPQAPAPPAPSASASASAGDGYQRIKGRAKKTATTKSGETFYLLDESYGKSLFDALTNKEKGANPPAGVGGPGAFLNTDVRPVYHSVGAKEGGANSYGMVTYKGHHLLTKMEHHPWTLVKDEATGQWVKKYKPGGYEGLEAYKIPPDLADRAEKKAKAKDAGQ